MTTQTLRNGDGKDLAMQPGETMLVVAVTGSYSASIIAGTGAPSVIATDATGGSYGPYAKGAVVRLRSSALSEIDFDIGTAPVVVSDTPVMASKTLTGGLSIPVNTSASAGNSIAICGDSLNANYYSGPGLSQAYKPVGPVAHAMVLSGQRLNIVYSGAKGSTELSPSSAVTPSITNQVIDAIGFYPNEILVNGGTNDLTGGNTLAEMKGLMLEIIRIVQKSSTAILRICDIPTASGSVYSVSRIAKTMAYNAWLGTLPTIFNFVRVLPWSQAVLDPLSSTGAWKTNYGVADGVHWSSIGAYYAGKMLAAQWALDYPAIDVLSKSTIDSRSYSSESFQLLPDPLWQTGAPVPTSWTVGGAATLTSAATKASRADGYGNDLVLPIQFAGGTTSDVCTLTGPSISITLGDKIRFLIAIDASNNPAASPATFQLRVPRIRLTLTMSNASFNMSAVEFEVATVDFAFPEAFSGVLATPWMDTSLAIGGGTITNASVQVAMFGAAAGGCTVKLGRPTAQVAQ